MAITGMESALRQIAFLRLWPKVPTPPNIIHVEPSGGCNLKCITCPQSVADKSLISQCLMSDDTFDTILKQASGFFKEMYFAVGGEPLLHPKLHEMIAKAKSAGLLTTVHTNATLLTARKSEEIINSGLDRITLNILDDKDEYERVRQGAKFEISVANIQAFLETKKRLGRGPFTTVQAVKPYKPEYGGAPASFEPEFMRRFDAAQIDRTVCLYAHHFGGDFADNAAVHFDEPEKADTYFPCQEIWIALAVAWDGQVRPCCIDLQGAYPLGNVHNDTLRNFWNCEKMMQLRKTLAKGKPDGHPLCAHCSMPWRNPPNKPGGGLQASVRRMISKKIPC